MGDMVEVYSRLNDHEKRLTKTEQEVLQMAPMLHVSEQFGRMQREMLSLQKSVEHSAKETQKSISQLTEESSETMRRLGELNEEQMRRAGEAERAKNAADLALVNEKLAIERQRAEDGKIINKIKFYWTPILVLVVTGAAAFAVVWRVVEWLLRNAV